MTLKEIVQKRPHLKETLELYSKVLRFKKFTTGIRGALPSEGVAYTGEEAARIIREFSEIFLIPVESLLPVQEAMTLGSIDLSRIPFGEVPAFSLPYQEEELLSILFLISKPLFLAEGRKLDLNGIFWTEGKCPVCNSTPSVSLIGREEKRRFYCTFCETIGHWKRIGCPNCLTENTDDLSIISLEGEEGMRVDTCERCKGYYKSFESYLLSEYTPDVLDLISLPLDIIAQGKGLKRHSPNPIGMIRMA